jgi:ubiquinone/menaquinone biosynthesis C-methylase UbiE
MSLDAFPLQPDEDLKRRVKAHWEQDPCAIRYVDGDNKDLAASFANVDKHVYEIDYMRAGFARFEAARDKKVLEVGLGVGSDLLNWARAGAIVSGVDLTEASVTLVRKRLEAENLVGEVLVGDAENLPFPDAKFDLYYSWGVLHHTPDTVRAVAEAFRVLKPGGTLKLMLYHYPSVFAYLAWMLHGPLKGKFSSPRKIVFDNVESPGTKSFTDHEVREILLQCGADANNLEIHTYLASPDLLSFGLSEKYQSLKWRLLQQIYPRTLVKSLVGDRFGTFMTLETSKP